MAFADTWAVLRARLREGVTVPNWTAHRGFVGEPFAVEAVTHNIVVVSPPGAMSPQSIRKKDFEAVYEHWEGYLGGSIPRQTFTPLTRYSKYVISILHWLQERTGGPLP